MQIEFSPGTEATSCDEVALNWMRQLQRADIPGFDFDSAFLTFVRNFFGGKPIRNKYSGRSGTVLIDRFLNFESPPRGDFSHINEVWSAIEDRLLPGLIPIADNGMGDYFCLDHSAGTPTVVLWVHELSAEGRPHLELVAPSFQDFISGLKAEA